MFHVQIMDFEKRLTKVNEGGGRKERGDKEGGGGGKEEEGDLVRWNKDDQGCSDEVIAPRMTLFIYFVVYLWFRLWWMHVMVLNICCSDFSGQYIG
jgi:hypothetical protein